MNRIFKCLRQLPILLIIIWVALNLIGVSIWQDFTFAWMKYIVTDVTNTIALMTLMLCLLELLPASLVVLLYVTRKDIAEECRKEIIIFKKLIHGQTCDQ